MKKTVCIALCLLLLLSLTSCGSTKSNSSNDEKLNAFASDMLNNDQMHIIVGGNGEIISGNISADNGGETPPVVEDPHKPKEEEDTHTHDWMEATCIAPMTCSI